MKIRRISENVELLGMPELSRDELKAKYGPEGDYNSWRQKQAEEYLKKKRKEDGVVDGIDETEEEQRLRRLDYLNRRGDEMKNIELKDSEISHRLANIEDTKIDMAKVIGDILGNSLKKGDSSFKDELQALINKYSKYKYTETDKKDIKVIGAEGVVDIKNPSTTEKGGENRLFNLGDNYSQPYVVNRFNKIN